MPLSLHQLQDVSVRILDLNSITKNELNDFNLVEQIEHIAIDLACEFYENGWIEDGRDCECIQNFFIHARSKLEENLTLDQDDIDNLHNLLNDLNSLSDKYQNNLDNNLPAVDELIFNDDDERYNYIEENLGWDY